MPRQRKNSKLREEMCARLRVVAEEYLKLGINELSQHLDYANNTVVRKVWNGMAFPDSERLVKLIELKTPNGDTPNLHWIISGEGLPVMKSKSTKDGVRQELRLAIDKLSESKIKALLNLLS